MRSRRDPRHYQIVVLAALLAYGVLALDFQIEPGRASLVLATTLATQFAFERMRGVRGFDPRSALISGLSLCLLLRAAAWPWAAATAVLTIASKFLIRVRGRHVFNPTNFGLCVMMAASDRVWVSPGQWGSVALFAFALACLGGIVVNRAARADVTGALLGSWVALLFGRAAWLGDPWSIPLRQIQSGALLVFAFFMISDPKTTPASRPGRLLFAANVALLGAAIEFGLYRPHGLLWALVLCAPWVPLLDRWLPGPAYRWPASPTLAPKGESHVPLPHPRPVPARLSAGP